MKRIVLMKTFDEAKDQEVRNKAKEASIEILTFKQLMVKYLFKSCKESILHNLFHLNQGTWTR